jgi:16S rRNA (adenine1518-N6/adenine1519-N6)-dimethyltransferase
MSPYHAKKRLGQNFLISDKFIQRIVDRISAKGNQTIVEIGAGQGALTIPLAETGAKIWAIEFDRDLIRYLEDSLDKFENVKILNMDFLAFHPELYELDNFLLVGNLPYNITSPVIDWCIRYHDRIQSAWFMVQKELAQRLVAEPKTKDWSPLSIIAQLHFNLTYCFDVPPQVFDPQPEVYSGFLRLEPIPVRKDVDLIGLDKVIRTAFQQRRKQLVNNLVPDLISDAKSAKELFVSLNIPEKARAEELSIDQFVALANILIPRRENER